MMWVGEQWLCYGKTISADEVEERVFEVTASQVRSVARDCFRSERISLALVSPVKANRKPGWERILALEPAT